jgi:hypothetical protein
MLLKFKPALRLLTLPAMALLGACDNPVDADDSHFETPTSVEITDLAGAMIAKLQGDHWDYSRGGDALHLHPGDEMEVRIFFIADDGDRFQLPPSGEEHTLRVEVKDPAIVEYEGHADHGHFVAGAAGETTAAIQVYHGSHADWQTNPPIAIEVVDHGAH